MDIVEVVRGKCANRATIATTVSCGSCAMSGDMMEEDPLGSRLAVSGLEPLSNAGSWQRRAKDAAIREEHRRSGGIHGLNGG